MKCQYCKKKFQAHQSHLEVCPNYLGSFEEQFAGNSVVLDPLLPRSQTHIATVKKTVPHLEKDDDIAIFACGTVMSHFPTHFSKEEKDKVHQLTIERLPFCTDFLVQNRRLIARVDIRSPLASFNHLSQMSFLDSGGWY